MEHREQGRRVSRLEFDREKWQSEIEMRERGQARSRWTDPLVVAIFAAAFAALGNAVVAVVNGRLQRELEASKRDAELALEESKAESVRILEMIKTGDTETAAKNLTFLLDTRLIELCL